MLYKSSEYAKRVWEVNHPVQANQDRLARYIRSEQNRLNTVLIFCTVLVIGFVAYALLFAH